MKRILLIVLAVLCFYWVIPISAVAAARIYVEEGYRCNLSESKFVKGLMDVYVSGKEGDSFSLHINGKIFYPNLDSEPEIRILYQGGDGVEGREIKTDSTSNAANRIGLNGITLGRFPSDGSTGVRIKASKFLDGENAISVIIGGFFGDGPYDENKPHGQGVGNQGSTKDDFLLSNVRFVLPDGKEVIPDGLVSYKAKAVGSKEKVITRYKPYPFQENEMFWLGDGWGTYETWAGNTSNGTRVNSIDKGRLDIPYKVEFLLDYKKPDSEAIFKLDTTDFDDGIQTIQIYSGERCVWSGDLLVDNTKPLVKVNFDNYQKLENGFDLEVSFDDTVSGIKTNLVRLEGKEIGKSSTVKYKIKDLKPGVHSIVFEASDNAGNTTFETLYFYIVDKVIPVYRLESDSEQNISIQIDSPKKTHVTIFEMELLEYNSFYGTFDGSKRPKSEEAFPKFYINNIGSNNEGVTTKSVSGMPYHSFDVDVRDIDSESINVHFYGGTIEGERFAIKAYNNQTSTWDTLDTGIGTAQLSVSVDLKHYVSDGFVRVMVVPDYVDNGSKTFLWMTDPQHYTKFEDLNTFYYGMYQYAAKQYLAGNIGYIINTGDLVDDSPSSALAENQWRIADKALDFAESNGVPSGVVTGNHDTGNYPSVNYNLFWKSFGADRYRNKPYYGGSLNNNASHYDLVTIGNTDLIVVYLGYGVEGAPETVAWANQILKRYSHRNAIICTHQYLSATTGGYDVSSRAEIIFNQIVVPNENVKMLLCGHNHGAVRLEKKIGERIFHEILSDYQFIQKEPDSYYNGNKHYQGSVPYCNGEGYLRSMTIEGHKVRTQTFSPITGGKNPFGIRDEFEIDVAFLSPKREITTYGFSATLPRQKIDSVDIQAGKRYISRYTGDKKVLGATLATESKIFISTPLFLQTPIQPQKVEVHLTPVDLYNLQLLVESAQLINETDYLKDSFFDFSSKLNEVNDLLKVENCSELEISNAYTDLFIAMNALQPKIDGMVDINDLITVYEYDLALNQWENSNGPKELNSAGSYLQAEQSGSSWIKINKTSYSPNNWPQMKYRVSEVEFTPVKEKIYLYLDVDATSGWVLYPIVKQGRRTANFRLNYAIEGLSNPDSDGGPGIFKGVYDVTNAFLNRRFDLTQPLQITMMINAVPGPVTIKRLAIMVLKEPSSDKE